MKKGVCSVLTKVGFAALALSLNFFAACEIGLGSSVDVEAPKIDFSENTLASGAVVRDAFAVFGSWTDDGSIGSINATLRNLGSDAEIKKAGTIGENLWNVTFSPAEDSIADGSYELSVVIKDSADHETKISRSFIIDNTPPLVVLSRPSTKIGATSFDSYGQKFTLEGKAADDNDVSLIEVNVYADSDCSGTPLKTISLPSVPLTIETDVAEYSKTEANDYSVIYGIVDDNGIAKRNGGTVDRFCKLVVYDGAQRYPADGSAQTEADRKGNSVDYYYLNSDLAELFTEGYKITELYHILNGTYSENAARATTPDGVISLLQSDSTKITTGQFRLNPENSPHFVVSARSILESGHTVDESPLTNGNSKLEVEITPGLDGHLIKEDTIGIYLVRCDNYGNPLKADGSAAANESEAKIVWLVETDKHEQQADITQSGSTYKFKTKSEVGNGSFPDLNIGENYYVAVVGKDMQGNNILCEGIYGFQLITSGLNIDVGLTVTPEWLSNNSNANSINRSVKVTLTYATDNKPLEILRGLDSSNLQSLTNNEKNVYTSPYVDTSLDISSEPTIVCYKVEGSNSAASNIKQVALKYDDDEPVVSDIRYPTAEETESLAFQFSGKAIDGGNSDERKSGITKVYLQITNKENKTTGPIEITWSSENWEKNLIKANYPEVFKTSAEGPMKVEIWAEDKVGLKSEIITKTDWVYDTGSPSIAITGTVPSIVGKKMTLSGTASDNYEIKKLELWQTKTKDKDGNAIPIEDRVTVKRDITNAASWTSPELPIKSATEDYSSISDDVNGEYNYEIIVTDKAGKTNKAAKTVILNTRKPGIIISTDLTKWQHSNIVTISGSASSPATVTGVYYQIFKNVANTPATPSVPANPSEPAAWTSAGWLQAGGTNIWSFTLEDVPDSENNVLFVATADNAGNASDVLTKILKVDSTDPEFEALKYKLGNVGPYDAEGQVYVDGTKDIVVYGKYSDSGSGVEKLIFTLKGVQLATTGTNPPLTVKYSASEPASGKTVTDLTDWVDFSTGLSKTTKYWKATIAKSAISSKNNCGDFKATVKNGTDTSSEIKLFGITFDEKGPAIALNEFSSTTTKKPYKQSEDVYYVNNKDGNPKFSLKGVATDNYGVKEVKLTIAGNEYTRDVNSSLSEWEFNNIDLFSYAETAEPEVKLTVTDVAGKIVEKTFTLKFDVTKPLALHWADAKGKDVYFRIGKADNDKDKDDSNKWETKDSVSDENNPFNKDVGKKYSYGSWGNDSTIEIRGNFKDDGAGLKAIHYAIFKTEPDSDQITKFINGTLKKEDETNVVVISNFAPLAEDKIETRHVPYNISSSEKGGKVIETNFRAELPGFNEKNNYLVLVAEDQVGNRAADTLQVSVDADGNVIVDPNEDTVVPANISWNSSKQYYAINKETDKPVVETDIQETQYTNGSNAVTVTGTAYDEDSHLSSIAVYIEEQGINYHPAAIEAKDLTKTNANAVEADDNRYSWSFVIPKEYFPSRLSGKSVTAYVTAVDNAGIDKTISAASITIDTDAPRTKISTPNDAVTSTTDVIDINGTINIGGTSEEVDIKKVLGMCYQITDASVLTMSAPGNDLSVPDTGWVAPSGWIKVNTSLTNVNATTNWTFKDIDTSKLDGTNAIPDDSTVWLTVAMQDKAGNVGYADPIKVRIDQNTDRPIITLNSSINFNNKNEDEIWVKGSTTIYGNVIDDDGIAEFKIYSKNTSVANSSFVDANATYSAGSWNVSLPGDGSYILKFEVKDTADKTFTSAALTSSSEDSELLVTPVIQDASDKTNPHKLGLVKESTLLPICVDTNPPSLTIKAISYDKTDESAWNEKIDDSTFYLGGTKDTFYIKVTASDPSGLAESSAITASFTGDMKVGNDVYRIISDDADCTVENVSGTNEYILTIQNYKTAGLLSGETISTTDTKDFSGTLTISVIATDKAGLVTAKSFSKTIDNAKPQIKISAPTMVSSTAVVTGTVEGENVTPKVYYTLSKTNTQPAANSTDWKQEEYATLSYNIYFDGAASTNSTHTHLFRTWLTEDYLAVAGATQDAIADGTYQTITPVYVWIKAEDICGNAAYLSAQVAVDPQGNRPSAEITYPDNTENLKLGGTIRVMGTANDNVEAKYAWIQLDITGTRGTWDLNDYDKLKDKYTFGQISTNKKLGTGADEVNITPSDENISDIAIMIPVSGGSWYQNINASGELIPSGDSNTVKMWVYATDDDAGDGTSILKSYPASKSFVVDKDNPYFDQNSLKLVQYETNATGEGDVVAEQKYIEGMSIKGIWWLTGDIKDDNAGISIISVKEDEGQDVEKINTAIPELTSGNYQFRQDKVTITTETPNRDIYNYKMKMKVGNASGVGRNTFRITVTEAKDNNPLSTYKDFMINYDNQAPAIAAQTHNKFNISKEVKNSNGYYYLTSAAYENYDNDTGVERIAVYFTRNLDGETYVFDPMYKRGFTPTGGTDVSKLATVTSGTGIIKDAEDNLYWGSATASKIEGSTLTLSANAASYVHVGGLAKVKGVVYRITSVSDDEVTLSGEPGDSTDDTAVSFAVASIVDNTSAESGGTVSAYKAATGYGYGYCSNYTYDDGDCIMENLHKDDSKSWTWELWVNSKNIPDGDVDVHYVVFDKAGNSTYDHVSNARVENNTPKLVSVSLGLDTNQNGSISGDEQEDYLPAGRLTKPGRYADAADEINISGITVKGAMKIIPEIVGGNGELYYRWKTKTKTDWTEESEKLMDGNDNYDDEDRDETNNYINNGVLQTNATSGITHSVDWLITNSVENCDDYSISYEIWDSTEGKTKFSSSNKVSINISDIKLRVYDEEAPEVKINSLQAVTGEGHLDQYSTDDDVNNLPAATFNGTGLKDKDSKVSGKVVFTGIAKDNIVLTDLYLKIEKLSGITTSTKVATYDRTNAKWKNAAADDDFAKVGTLASDGYEFDLSDNEFDIEHGHSVKWTLTWDTEKITNIADTEINVQILAHDDAVHAGHDDGNFSGNANQKVDVVPYITVFNRPNAKTNTHRSRRGKYQVVVGENLEIEGFNLPGNTAGSIKLQISGNKSNDTVKTAINPTADSGIHKMKFTAPETSGYIKVVTNGVSSINNFNALNAMESEYSGDEWTDDVYLNVWKNDEYFWFSNDPISPSMDRSPNGNGQHRLYGGWGTQGSKVYASYPSTTGTGSSGNAPGPNNGGGTGTSCQGSSGYGDPISYYDVATDASGNRYNVIIDCWQGSTNGWGGNFVINKNGASYHNGCNTTNYSLGSTNMRHVIERMGAGGTAPDNANSSDGLDEIFNQFLNPRIAVYGSSAYITYYDRYAKCLKWAMSTPPDNKDNNPTTKYATEGVITSSTYSTNHYKTGGMVVAGYDTLQTGGSLTNLNVGMWSDIAIDTTAGKPVIAYYDSTNRRLMVATSASAEYPVNSNTPILSGTATSATEGDAWTRQVVDGSATPRLGEYVSLALDGGNNIHIACKGAKDGSLYYVYGARTAYGSYTWTTVCVDNNGSPGNWTDIKLTNPSGSGAAAGPVISYYDPTNDATEDAVKVAYLESTASNAAANWDTMTVPCNTSATANRITLALDVTDGANYTADGTSNNSKLAIGYVSSRFDCVYLRKE